MLPTAMSRDSLLIAAGILALAAAPAAAEPARMTFAEAVERAVKQYPEVTAASLGAQAADLTAAAISAQQYPKVMAEARVFRWNAPIVTSFQPTLASGVQTMAQSFVAREQLTAMVSVAIEQPISGLYALNRLIAIERYAVAGARSNIQRARLDAAERAAVAYLQILQAQAKSKVAAQSVSELEAQVGRAAALEREGTVAGLDVLRWTAQRDSARQNLLRAQAEVELAMARLQLALGDDGRTSITVVDDLPDPPVPIETTEAVAGRRAVAQRPEVKEAESRSRQAEASEKVALAEWLPNIMAVANAQRNEGQGPFLPKNAWYLGATLTWDLWDWGSMWKRAKAAEATAARAAVDERLLRDQIALEVRTRFVEMNTAFRMLNPAETALAAAEEAFRIQKMQYAEGVTDTTDLIVAESDVTRARGARSDALYNYYLSQVAFARAAGELPGLAKLPR